MPDSEITSRLPSILLGVARVWYRVTFRSHRGASWEEWKSLMKTKFNTSTWRMSQLALRDKEKFSYANSDTLVFLLQMHKRIQAVYPEGGIEDQKSHMIMRLPVEVQTAIKTSARGVTDISEFISICEEVINNSWAKVNSTTRRYIPHRNDVENQPSKRPFEKKKPVTVPLHRSSNDHKPKEKRTCYKCKAPWSENHKCKEVQINLVEEEEDKSSSESESLPPSDGDLAFNSDGEFLMLTLDEPEILTTNVFKSDEVR